MRARLNRPAWRCGVFAGISLVLSLISTDVRAQLPTNLPAPGGNPAGIHRVLSADSPPGVVGAARVQRVGAIAGYFQPVVFRGPGSTSFSLAIDGAFQPPNTPDKPLHAGLLVGGVYRFRVTSIPGFEGEELFPTLEVIDRTYPPHHLALRHPIPIELDVDDLRDALAGQLVTRVIYLEDRATALPIEKRPEQPMTLDIPAYQDPLAVADSLGRPVAILRIGSLLPPTHASLMPQFFFGYPAWISIPAEAIASSVANEPAEQPQPEPSADQPADAP